MSAKIIDGKLAAANLRAELKANIAELKAQTGQVPGLAVILVGDDPASQSYVTAKEKACAEIGILSVDNRLPATTSQDQLLDLIHRLNDRPDVHGILAQLPLPRHLDESLICRTISPEKDVDCFHPVNVGKLMLGEAGFLPCTPHGIVKLLEINGVQTDGAHVVVVGRSNIVGKPIANMLLQKCPNGNATVTLCHTHTRNLAEFTRQADILIAAAGRPHTISADMVKAGAVVIDVGVNRVPTPELPRGYRLVGDVDFEAVKEKAALITPVPGGVGPMTIIMLLYNTVYSARRHILGA